MPYSELYCHLVWATKNRVPLLTSERTEIIHRSIRAACREHDAVVHAVVELPITFTLRSPTYQSSRWQNWSEFSKADRATSPIDLSLAVMKLHFLGRVSMERCLLASGRFRRSSPTSSDRNNTTSPARRSPNSSNGRNL